MGTMEAEPNGKEGQKLAETAEQGPLESAAQGEEPLPWRENPMLTRGPFILCQEFCERMAYNG